MSMFEVSSSIVANVCLPAELPDATHDELFELFSRHFDNVSRTQFERDLFGKNVVLTLRDSVTGAMTGFSTMLVYETCIDGAPVSVVYSGDTLVDPSAWNSAALPREWIAAVNRLRADFSNGPY